MAHPIHLESQLLEEAFFRKRDAELIAEIRRRESLKSRKKLLAEVSGITDESVLDQLVAHDIHVEALAAFSLVPVIEVAWADGEIQPAERALIVHAIEETGIPKESISFQLLEQWLKTRPGPNLMKLWRSYTGALMRELTPDAGDRVRQTVLDHARAVAKAAGGFLGLARISRQEEKVLGRLERAFESKPA